MATELQIEGTGDPVSPTTPVEVLAAIKNMKWQVITVNVFKAGEHVKINDLASVTNERIRGIVLTASTSFAYDALKRAYMDLTIDQEEVFPQDFDTSLILKLDECTLKQCLLNCNFHADGSQITGNFYDRTPATTVNDQGETVPAYWPEGGYSFKINLYSGCKNPVKS